MEAGRCRRLAVLLAAVLTGAATADEVVLTTGERLIGVVRDQTAEVVVLDHPVLGTLVIASESVAEIIMEGEGPPGEPVDPLAEVADPVPPADAQSPALPSPESNLPSDGVEPEPAPDRWQISLDFGGSATTGNNESQSFKFGGHAERETEQTSTRIDLLYYFGLSNGVRSDNKLTARVRNDWLMPERTWFVFGQARYEYDEFKSWEQRLGGDGGLAVTVTDRESLKITLRLGGGVAWDIGAEEENVRPEALLGGEISWQISPRQKLASETQFHADLDDVGEYRAITVANWLFELDPDTGTSLSIGIQNEYLSQVPAGQEHNDMRIFGGLRIDF